MSSATCLADLYRLALEMSLEKAHAFNVSIPHDKLDDLDKRLRSKLFLLDHSRWSADEEESSKAALAAAKNISQNVPITKMAFSSCSEHRGRYHSFQSGPKLELIDNDKTPDAVRKAVSDFGENFSSAINRHQPRLANSIPQHHISFSTVVGKGVLCNKQRILDYFEFQLNSGKVVYTKYVCAKLYLHAPSAFEASEISWQFGEMSQQFGGKPVTLPILQISDSSIFKATTHAEFTYEVVKGLYAKSWATWLSLGLNNLIFDKEGKMEFESPQFELQFYGKKSFFKPKCPPKIDISKESAQQFLAKMAELIQFERYLGKKDSLLMLDHNTNQLDDGDAVKLIEETVQHTTDGINSYLTETTDFLSLEPSSPDVIDSENVEGFDHIGHGKLQMTGLSIGIIFCLIAAVIASKSLAFELTVGALLVIAAVAASYFIIRKDSPKVKTFGNQCRKSLTMHKKRRETSSKDDEKLSSREVIAAWVMSVNVSSGGEDQVSTADYLMRLIPVSGMSYTHLLEVYRSTMASSAAIGILKEGAARALEQTMAKKYQIILDHETLNTMSRGNASNMSAFAFEELMNAKVLAAAAKQGIALELVQGDGLGVVTNAQGVQMKTPEYVDAVFREVGTDNIIGAYQYKNVAKEFNDNGQGQQVHNVDQTVNSWETHWRAKSVDPNMPKELLLENVEVIVPRGNNEGATTTRASDKIEIKDLKVSSISTDELDSFMNTNESTLRAMIKLDKPVKDSIDKLEKEMIELTSLKEKLKNALDKANNKDAIRSKLKGVEENIEKCTKLLEDKKTTLEQRHKLLAKKMQTDQTQAERQLAIKQLNNQFKQALILAAAISAGKELIVSLVEEIQTYKQGKQTLGSMALNVTTRTIKASVVGTSIAGGFALASYGLGRMALSQSSQLARNIGLAGCRWLGPVAISLGLGYQSYEIIKSYRNGDIDKPEMALQFTRMTGLTVASMACFKLAAVACASTGVGLAVGAVACIILGVADYFLFKEDPSKALEKKYQKLRAYVIDTAYAIFDLERNCTDAELRNAYKTAMRKYHPDKNPDHVSDVEDQAKAIIVAYELLRSVRSTARST